jgi:hypothetical protein
MLENPELYVQQICSKLSIPYFEQQLTWVAGPKPDIDG